MPFRKLSDNKCLLSGPCGKAKAHKCDQTSEFQYVLISFIAFYGNFRINEIWNSSTTVLLVGKKWIHIVFFYICNKSFYALYHLYSLLKFKGK